jgi:Flp pilus assembly secretin CpaC
MMALLCGRRGPGFASIPAIAFAFSFAIFHGPSTADAADITVVLDQARLMRLPERASTIVIGNPLIADVTLQAGGTMVVTGKGYGITNLIALDRSGAVLMEKSVEVKGPRAGVVVVYRGVERETYSCAPFCERRITLGDGATYFDQTIGQTATRNGLAQGMAPAAK